MNNQLNVPTTIYETYFKNFGWGNGYIVLPPDHPFYGKDYEELHYMHGIHGGFTYSDYATPQMVNNIVDSSPNLYIEIGKDYILGFDTNHIGDSLTRWPQKAVIVETQRINDAFNLKK